MTYDQFIAEIAKSMKPDDAATSPLVAAIWYVAHQHAEEFRDLTTRELAETIAEGLPPIDEAYVRSWWDDQYPEELEPQEIADLDESFRDSIKDFFNPGGDR